MHEQISRNKRASVALLAVMAGVLLGLGYFVGLVCSPTGLNRLGVPCLFALVAALWSLAAYYWGGSLALAASHAREVGHDAQPQLWNVVEEISIAAGVPMPRVYLIDDPAPNALAAGRDPRHAGVAVTTGLLALVNRQELQGVLAHEVAHVRNYDVRFATLACAIVGVVAASGVVFLQVGLVGPRLAELLLSDACDRQDKHEVGASFVTAVFLLLLAVPALVCAAAAGAARGCSRLVQLAISRRREYLADASAVELTRDPLALACALEKIAACPARLAAAHPATAHLFIANPLKEATGWVAGFLDVHPQMEKRIAVLRAMGHADDAAAGRP